jgi:hypothetical protein
MLDCLLVALCSCGGTVPLLGLGSPPSPPTPTTSRWPRRCRCQRWPRLLRRPRGRRHSSACRRRCGRRVRWRRSWPPPPRSAPTWRSSGSTASPGSRRAGTFPSSSLSPAHSRPSSRTGRPAFALAALSPLVGTARGLDSSFSRERSCRIKRELDLVQ